MIIKRLALYPPETVSTHSRKAGYHVNLIENKVCERVRIIYLVSKIIRNTMLEISWLISCKVLEMFWDHFTASKLFLNFSYGTFCKSMFYQKLNIRRIDIIHSFANCCVYFS